MDSMRARLHSSSVSSDRDQPPAAWPRRRILGVTKQHRNDRWDRCTASAGDWQIITTTSHRSANQRYFMHNSATVHRMRMQSSALDSSRSQLCNDTSTGVVRHQITKRRRLQKVVSYDVLHLTNKSTLSHEVNFPCSNSTQLHWLKKKKQQTHKRTHARTNLHTHT